MADSSSQTGQSSQGTNARSSIVFGSFDPQEITPDNYHGAVDISLSLNSAANLPSQHQANPMSGQIQFRQHGTEPSFRRSNPSFPSDLRMNHMSHSHSMQPPNTLNVNIVVGNNSSININLLNNNISSQFATNNLFASSPSNTPVQNNAINSRSSGFNPLLLQNQERLTNSVLHINESPQFSTSYLPYSSPRITIGTGNPLYTSVPNHNQEIPVGNPCLRQNVVNPFAFRGQASNPGQNIHWQDHIISQSSSDLSSLRLPTRYSPHENQNAIRALPISSMNPAEEQFLDFQGRNDNSTEDEHRHQRSLQSPDSQSESEHIGERPQLPSQNDNWNESQGNLAEAYRPKPRSQLNPDARRRQNSSTRCKSHPYIKYGPYTCPRCQLIFDKGSSYAAHVTSHYKDETPNERNKRREGKFKSKDLHIAQCNGGITVMPGPPPMPQGSTYGTTICAMGTSRNQGEGSSYVKIKEEKEETDSD